MQELENLLGYQPDWPRLTAAKDQRIIDLHVELDALPGVRDLLADARSQGIPTAVASSSDSSHVFRWLHRLDLRASFDVICTRDDVARAKPAPDLFLLASRQLDIPREAAVVLEDSENGLKAAVAAEIPCIIVPNQITQHSDFAQASAILPTLEGVGAWELFRAVR
jgi:HAD superfamily hydrolase (TIGR01509 family)